MRRIPAIGLAVGVMVGWLAIPTLARAGIWVTLAAGVPGGSTPTSEAEFWFDSPHGPQVAITQLTGGLTAEARTGGGGVFFGGGGTPVLLNLADGSAYVASGSPSDALLDRGPKGGSAGTRASAAPEAGATVPPDAALLGINVSDPKDNGSRSLTATVTDAAGNLLGTGSLDIPADGSFVLGLGQGTNTDPSPDPVDPGPIDPPPTDDGGNPPVQNPPPVDNNPPPNTGSGGPVAATPEPSTAVMVGLGGLAAGTWRLRRRMK